ncbi:MAG: hypothetical protein U0183_14445 [Polyangiaceae bacterium]
MKRPRGAKNPFLRTFQLVALVVALVGGVFIFSNKVLAQPKPAPKAGAAQAAAPAEKAPAKADKATPPGKDAGAPKDAGLDATSATATAPPSDAGAGDGGESPLDYAEVQGPDDFPKDMSDEEKSSIGTGKVPIHREGPFKSPFAHPRFGGPTIAKVGLVIQEVREYNIQTGAFEAQFFLSLTGDKELPKLDLYFPNGHEVEAKPLADTPTFKLYRVSGKFLSPVDLREYPFDTQNLAIEIEDQSAGVDQLLFVPDKARTSLDEGFDVASFGVASVGAHAYRHAYPPRFDRDDLYVSRYKFVLGLDRFATSAAFSVYVPAYIIVLISLIGLWVPADELEVRSNAGAPMLAAAVLFHYSLISALPATGYLTHADKLMLGVYVSLLLNMLTTWAFLVVDDDEVEPWFRRFRAVVPPLTVVVMAVASVI